MADADGRSTRIRLRRSWQAGRVQARQSAGQRRVLPDALIIGTQRGGTTSLYEYLSQHPDVVPPLGKELQYFSTEYERGDRWYRAHFPTERAVARRKAGGRGCVVFEASPYYLFHPHAAARAAATVPAAKLIALLRDPVERAYSHYEHMRQRGLEPLAFEEAVAAEPERLAGEVERMQADPRYQSRAHRIWSYVSRGRYAAQLSTWLAHFPREQLLVLRSEDLFADPAAALRRVHDFVGVEPVALPDYPAYTRRRPGPPLRDDTRDALRAEFRASNDELRQLLGQAVGWA
ncbi:MAG: sulfotransferase domain-containing protein [Actinobacteria bacterium]|nr:sulfotransferase domain-containing protein [Actinomycetota bacterium]MBV9253812.1 sulfotransferase domain-containing protein [Actinomycetota bacterium]